MMDKNVLLSHIDLLHTTPMGINRIRKNLGLDCIDIINYCKDLKKTKMLYL